MNIDKSKLKLGIWYEDVYGNRIPSMDDRPEPVTKVGAHTYHVCFPLRITEEVFTYHDKYNKETCKHKRKWWMKHRDMIKGYKGHHCSNCGCTQVRKWWQPWGRNWDNGTSITPLINFNSSIGGGNETIILAMVNSGDYTLSEALVVWANACERCMNVLAYKYTNGEDGYPEFSDEWNKCGTVCDFCKEES